MDMKRALDLGDALEGAIGGQMEADDVEDEELDERRLLSRYGIWLMIELCSPTEKTPIVRRRMSVRLSVCLSVCLSVSADTASGSFD